MSEIASKLTLDADQTSSLFTRFSCDSDRFLAQFLTVFDLLFRIFRTNVVWFLSHFSAEIAIFTAESGLHLRV